MSVNVKIINLSEGFTGFHSKPVNHLKQDKGGFGIAVSRWNVERELWPAVSSEFVIDKSKPH